MESVSLDLEETGQPREDQHLPDHVHLVVAGGDVDLKEIGVALGLSLFF